MVNFNANVSSVIPKTNFNTAGVNKNESPASSFTDTVKAAEKYISKVDDIQQTSEMSIKDLLAGKNEDINSVVAAVAKADMSFKLLVGVRNQLIDAYKQTMNMQI